MKISKKMKSRRFYIVLWSVLYVSGISVYSVKTQFDAAWIAGTLALVVGIIITWMGFSSAKKKEGE